MAFKIFRWKQNGRSRYLDLYLVHIQVVIYNVLDRCNIIIKIEWGLYISNIKISSPSCKRFRLIGFLRVIQSTENLEFMCSLIYGYGSNSYHMHGKYRHTALNIDIPPISKRWKMKQISWFVWGNQIVYSQSRSVLKI